MSIINSFIDELNIPEQKPLKKPVNSLQQNIKFPVDPVMKLKLRTMCKQASRLNNMDISQTKFNTLLLRYGIQQIETVDFSIPYQDSKVYMHSNLKKNGEYPIIGGPYGIAIRYGISERRAVYCIMVAMIRWVEQSGKLEKIL